MLFVERTPFERHVSCEQRMYVSLFLCFTYEQWMLACDTFLL